MQSALAKKQTALAGQLETAAVCFFAGALDLRSLTSSTPMSNPMPRTSPISAWRSCSSSRRFFRCVPTLSALAWMPSASMTSRVARPWVMQIGFPPKVLKWMRLVSVLEISGRVTIAPSGMPLPMPLAMVTTSGVTPQFSKAQKAVPVRPNPPWTSSATQMPPCLRHDIVDDLKYSLGGTTAPPTPWMHSAMKTATSPHVSYSIRSFTIVGAFHIAGWIGQPIWAAVTIRRRGVFDREARLLLNFHVPCAVRFIVAAGAAMVGCCAAKSTSAFLVNSRPASSATSLASDPLLVKYQLERFDPAGMWSVKFLGELADGRMEIDRRRRAEVFPVCFCTASHNFRMTMSDGNGDDPRETIEIPLAGFVPEVLHVSLDDDQRFLVIADQSRREILLPQRHHLRLGRPVIRLGRVLADGEGQFFLRFGLRLRGGGHDVWPSIWSIKVIFFQA